MAAFPDPPIVIELAVRSGHPALLEGLDSWLQLGLLSDATVRRLCAERLVCPLPQQAPEVASEFRASESARPTEPELVGANDFLPSEPLPPIERPTRPTTPRSPGWATQAMQAFLAEISVVWLLFLGVFLVVVSSGVLAATQWRNVPTIGQYGILLGYTLVFWLVALWTKPNPSLRLTHRMLTIATLLIIPVNVWMMDGLRLWTTPPGIGVCVVASLLLTGITVQLLPPTSSIALMLTAIALSALHWGWSVPGVPIVMTYLGTVGAALVLLTHDRARQRRPLAETAPPDEGAIATPPMPLPALDSLTILLSALLLLGRAMFIAQTPVPRLGLAVGICGWLLVWLARGDRNRKAWARAGSGLLLVAWLVTVPTEPPWQALAISGLALWLLADHLPRSGQRRYLTIGFLVGLQANWLIWRLLPSPWQQAIVQAFTPFTGPEAMPFALLGLGFFPYLCLVLGIAAHWRRTQQLRLANHAELLALGLGSMLAGLSLGNTTVRSLNLTLSAGALLAVLIPRSRPHPLLIHLTHGITLCACFSWIDRSLPTLSANTWASLFLGVMVLEWIIVAALPEPPNAPQTNAFAWRQSAWYGGLVLATLSYGLLWWLPWQTLGDEYNPWSPAWLVVPIGLTLLASRDRAVPAPRLASWLSIVALMSAQFLTITGSSGRIAGFGVAAVLMILNTYQLRNGIAAILTVGFGLGFWSVCLWEILGKTLELSGTIALMAFTLLGLWLLRRLFVAKQTDLARHYRRALDGWAIALFLFTGLLFLVHQLTVYSRLETANWQSVLAAGLLIGATSYRARQGANEGSWWAIAWSVELLITTSVALLFGFPQGSWAAACNTLAIANLVAGFVTLIWSNRLLPNAATVWFSWHLIPVVYAGLGLVWGHHTFTSTTGLFTAAGAVVAVGVGRRRAVLKPFTYLGLVGLSGAAYEGLIYQLMQAEGGKTGDGVVWLAGLAAGLAMIYRLFRRSLPVFLHLTKAELQIVAHGHWLFSNVLLCGAAITGTSTVGRWQGIAIAVLLALYALLIGRRYDPAKAHPSPKALVWTTLGIIEALIALAVTLRLWLPDTWLIDWGGAIATLLAIGFYYTPWQRLGWYPQVWQTAAVWLPGLTVLFTAWGVNLQSLLVAGAFYAWVASRERRIRLSYMSVLMADWAIARWLIRAQATEPLWIALLFGSSLLYLAQVDPALQDISARERRHWLRSLATGLICLTAFYQAEAGIVGLAPVVAGFSAIALALAFVLVGLLLRVRAFLYIGTLAFVVQVLWQLWRFFSDYSLLLWIFGIVLGAILIWGAATFEARRNQVNNLLERWMNDLDIWE